jgi:cell wall-associated NlpC family hydrolase
VFRLRARALAVFSLTLALAAPAQAQDSGGSEQSTAAYTGGAAYGEDPNAVPRHMVPGTRAVLMDDGYAAAPADAPAEVQAAVWAANEIVDKPYRYGGGHASFEDSGYDCSGTVSFALNAAGLLKSPLDSSSFMRWGKKGKGKWFTVYTNPGHAYVVIAGLRLDTSSAGDTRSTTRGPRWRATARAMRGFKRRHPAGF